MTRASTAIAGGLAGACLVSALPAAAALPPAYQRAREIVAVVEAAAPRLAEPIEAVRQTGASRFEVRAGRCRLEVRIVPLPVKVQRDAPPGPLLFDAVAGRPICH